MRLAYMAVAAVVMGGCVRSELVTLGETQEPRPAGHPIALYLPDTEAPVTLVKFAGDHKQPFEVPAGSVAVGRIELVGGHVAWKNILDRARDQARRIGGDALLYESAGTVTRSAVGGGVSVPMNNDSGMSVSTGAAYHKEGRQAAFTVLRYPEREARRSTEDAE